MSSHSSPFRFENKPGESCSPVLSVGTRETTRRKSPEFRFTFPSAEESTIAPVILSESEVAPARNPTSTNSLRGTKATMKPTIQERFNKNKLSSDEKGPVFDFAAGRHSNEKSPAFSFASERNFDEQSRPTLKFAAKSKFDENDRPVINFSARSNSDQKSPVFNFVPTRNFDEKSSPTLKFAAKSNFDEESTPAFNSTSLNSIECTPQFPAEQKAGSAVGSKGPGSIKPIQQRSSKSNTPIPDMGDLVQSLETEVLVLTMPTDHEIALVNNGLQVDKSSPCDTIQTVKTTDDKTSNVSFRSAMLAMSSARLPWNRSSCAELLQEFHTIDDATELDLAHSALYTTEVLKLQKNHDDIPFTRLLGSTQTASGSVDSLWFNGNVPQTSVVCGVQGAGKSYSTSVMLENCLVDDARIGDLPKALTGLVLHYDKDASVSKLPCEAAYLSSKMPVKVLVSYSNLVVMRKVYARFRNVEVVPLLFHAEDFTFAVMLKLMAVAEGSSKPLYINVVQALLQNNQEQSQGGKFDFVAFIKQLKAIDVFDPKKPTRGNDDVKLNVAQKESLQQRLRLLEGLSAPHKANPAKPAGSLQSLVSARKAWFKSGQLTIADLSDPFIDAPFACTLFRLLLDCFKSQDVAGGKILCVDEARKYSSKHWYTR